MILQLYNKQIIIKDNESPENIANTKVTYMYELGTNHLVPVLTLNGKSYRGDPANVSFVFLQVVPLNTFSSKESESSSTSE